MVFKVKKGDITAEAVVNTVWVSTMLAFILTLPGLGIFIYFFFNDMNLGIGALIGFGLHFVTLAFSGRISSALLKISS